MHLLEACQTLVEMGLASPIDPKLKLRQLILLL
jgi:hypothetical protein